MTYCNKVCIIYDGSLHIIHAANHIRIIKNAANHVHIVNDNTIRYIVYCKKSLAWSMADLKLSPKV